MHCLEEGFYHADMHKGNIFYSKETSELPIIDCGLCGEMNQKTINALSTSENLKNLIKVFNENKDRKVITPKNILFQLSSERFTSK